MPRIIQVLLASLSSEKISFSTNPSHFIICQSVSVHCFISCKLLDNAINLSTSQSWQFLHKSSSFHYYNLQTVESGQRDKLEMSGNSFLVESALYPKILIALKVPSSSCSLLLQLFRLFFMILLERLVCQLLAFLQFWQPTIFYFSWA